MTDEAEAVLQQTNDEPFSYEPQYKVLICKKHQHAVRGLETHLRKAHGLNKIERAPIITRYDALSLLDPKQVPLPPADGPPFEALGIPIKGFLCQTCDRISVNRKSMQGHCNSHGWKFSPENPIHWTEVWVQTFFRNCYQRYFTVRVESISMVPTSLTEKQARDMANILREMKESKARYIEEQAKADKKMEKSDNTGWFNLTRWPQHFQDRDIRHISHTSRLPDRKERILKQAAKVIDLMIHGAVDGLSSHYDDTPLWLKTAKDTLSVRPMVRLQNEESFSRYIGYWKRFICYCLRVTQGDTDEVKLKDSRELIKWHGEQKALLDKIWASLELDEEKVQIQNMLALSMSFVTQDLKGFDHFDSPLVHFAGVLGIDEEMSRLRRGEHYSYMLAGFVYCIRVIFVEFTLPSARRVEQTGADIDRFLEMRLKYLIVGSYSPMSTLVRMLGYGKKITMEAGNAPTTSWSRPDKKILYYRGKPLPMEDLRSMVHDMIRDTEDILWDDLMWMDKSQRFVMDLEKIEDDISANKRYNSFVSHEPNAFSSKTEWMLQRMIMAPKSRQLRDEERECWVMSRVKAYGRQIKRFLELLLALIHMTAGQPARGEEITPIRHQNGFLQDRNIYMLDGQVMVVTRYHKSQALFGAPKVIPRFLPWKVGQLMVVYLTYVQPFREELDQKTNGLPRSEHVWHDQKGPWNTEQLTKILTRETATRLGHRLTTADYRHVAIAIGREYVGPGFMRDMPAGEEGAEEGTDVVETAFNLQSGHGGAIAERYGVRSDIIKHLSDESIGAFQPLSAKWHGFLGLHSRRPVATTLAKHQRGPSDTATLVLSSKRSPEWMRTMPTGPTTPSPVPMWQRGLPTPVICSDGSTGFRFSSSSSSPTLSSSEEWGNFNQSRRSLFPQLRPSHSTEQVQAAMSKALGTTTQPTFGCAR